MLSNTNDSYYSLMTTSRNACDNVIIWHARLWHTEQGRMNRLTRENLLGQFIKIDMPTCEYCLASKTIRKSFGKGTRAEIQLQLIHSGICGHMALCTSSHL